MIEVTPHLLHVADVAARAVPDGRVEEVLDVAGASACHGRQDVVDDALDGEHREVADAQEEVAGVAEDAELAAVAEEHTGDPGQCEDGHQDLRSLPDDHLGGDDVGDIGRVVDLDADEDGAGGRGAETGDGGEAVGGDGHVGLRFGAGGVSGDVRNGKNRHGERTSHGDVIGVVIRLR